MNAFKRFLVALTSSILLLIGTVSTWMNPGNRFFAGWNWGVAMGNIVAILALAIALWLVGEFFRKSRFRGVLEGLLVASIVFAVVRWSTFENSMTPWLPSGKVSVAIALLMFVLTYSVKRWRLFSKYRCVALILSPLFLVVSFEFMAAKKYEEGGLDFKPRFESRKGTNPIYIFLFDEWSYLFSTQGGRWKAGLSNLKKTDADFFHFEEAYSPRKMTRYSIPSFLAQKPINVNYESKGGPVVLEGSQEDGVLRRKVSNVSNLFSIARKHRYNNSVCGFYLNYLYLYDGLLDGAAVHSVAIQRNSGVFAVAFDVFEFYWMYGLGVLNGKGLFRQDGKMGKDVVVAMNEKWRDAALGVIADAESVISLKNKSTLMFVHYSFPHHPFIFDASGGYVSSRASRSDEEGYGNNVKFLDLTVGRIIDLLKKKGLYDKAMIVFTSDHSWRYDPHRDGADDPDVLLRVPLLIKLPHQKDGVRVSGRTNLTELQPIFEAVMSGDLEGANAAVYEVPGEE